MPLRLPFAPLNLAQALTRVDEFVAHGAGATVCFCEANLYAHAATNPAVAAALRETSLVLADGIAVLTLARWQGQPLPERITGPAFLLAACAHGRDHGYRHFFYGGAPGVAERLAERLTQQVPGLIVCGTRSPPFRALTPEEEEADRQRIAAARPHLLWIGLGGPKQELLMAAWRGRVQVPVMLAVGAAFDFHSGNRAWAPPMIRRLGLEWLYRTLTGGRRTFWRNLRCVSRMAWELTKVAAARLTGRRE